MRILQNVNLQVMKGEMVAIMGTIRQWKDYSAPCADRVDTPDDGETVIGGETFSRAYGRREGIFSQKAIWE